MEFRVVVPTRIATLPSMFVEVVQKVLTFLNRLDGTRATPTVPTFQALVVYPTVVMAPKIDEASET